MAKICSTQRVNTFLILPGTLSSICLLQKSLQRQEGQTTDELGKYFAASG